MVTKRFSRTDSTENQSCLQLLRMCAYQVTSRLSSCLTITLLTCQLILLLANHSACFSRNFIAMNFIVQSTIINVSSLFKVSIICRLYCSWFSALRICPLYSKILAAAFFCFIQIVFRLKLKQLHCVLRNSASYFFKNILQVLTIRALHVVTVTAYCLKVCVTSITRCKDPTVIGTFPIVLFAVITVCSLQIQLAILKPLPNFFTPILFLSHAFQFVYNLEKILETIRSLSCSIV